MSNYLKRVFLHPVTHFNILSIGVLIVIGLLHNHAHHTMEVDADSYVKQFCTKNLEKCERYVDNDY